MLSADFSLCAAEFCLRQGFQSTGMRLVMGGEPTRFLRHELYSPMGQPIQRRDTHGIARGNSHAEINCSQPLNVQSFPGQFTVIPRDGDKVTPITADTRQMGQR